MNAQAPDQSLWSAVQDLRQRMSRARLLALPALLMALAYLGLLVGYWSAQIGKEWAAEAALILLALTWLSLIPAMVGLRHLAAWQCPVCGASALPPGKLLSGGPLHWWMIVPMTPRACLACKVSFSEPGKTAD